MGFEHRKRKILNSLSKKEVVEVASLVEEIGVSDITIRRDLAALEKLNLLKRTHGGATKIEGSPIVNFDLKSNQNQAEKEKIGQKAALEVKEGEVIFIDCGSTTLQMCSHLKHLNIKVITNSLPVVSALQNCQVSINLIGGELDQKRQAIHGKMAEWHIKQYHAHKAFIGADAIDKEGHLWANSETEAEISTAMITQSDKAYVLADSSKIGKKGYLKFSTETHEIIS